MGGDSISSFSVVSSTEDLLSLDRDFQEQSPDPLSLLSEVDLINGVDEGSVGHVVGRDSSVVLEAGRRRSRRIFTEVLQSYEELERRSESMEETKKKILSYAPGSWMEKVAGIKLDEYNVPEITTILLVGPKGAGKSSLVNRISRVLENDKNLPERAQVSYKSSAGEGTLFLQEYAIPRGSNSVCLYDTRSLSDDPSENTEMFTQWMGEGVRNGELVRRKSDSMSLMKTMRCRARLSRLFFSHNDPSVKARMVNFVVMVVNGLSVLEAMDSSDEGKKLYSERIAKEFNNPFLSFKDDKPAVVVTHGDVLDLSDRVRVRVFLGELLGIHPRTQVFDIADEDDLATESSIADLLCYCLEHADKNIPRKSIFTFSQIFPRVLSLLFCVMIMLALLSFDESLEKKCPFSRSPSNTPIVWQGMRHLWLGEEYD